MMNRIRDILMIAVALMMAAPQASSADFLEWLESATQKVTQKVKPEQKPADDATLVTLEDGQTEMYPQVSPDGRFLLVSASEGRKTWISRRATANGDPLNEVATDEQAIYSMRWNGEQATFLSERAGGLGLWQRRSDGTGPLRRLQPLTGQLIQPVALPDGGLIGVRLQVVERQASKTTTGHDGFNNWEMPGYRGVIVRIEADGRERILGEGMNPTLSPDGQWIAFTMPIGRDWHLFIMHTDGTELTQLTDERCSDVQPAWSGDGKWIVFTSNRAQVDLKTPSHSNWDIWAISRDASQLLQLTRDEARDGAPSVAKDGRVFFHSDRNIGSDLKEERQVKGSTSGFHIWSSKLPS